MGQDKVRILVVDDSASMRASAKNALNEHYEVLTCEDGMEALSMLAAFRPQLILVDITMPKLDGYETVSLIRCNDAFAEVPILMMSSKNGVFDVAKSGLIGFNGNIAKPFRPEEMRAAIATHLAQGG
jgi:twitching motility two-component system response regulator PilG